MSGFWFKVGDIWLFLALELLEAVVRLVTGLISIWSYLREQGGLRRGKATRDRLVGGTVRTHTFIGHIHRLTREWFVEPQNNYDGNVKDRWSQITVTNHEGVWNTVRITKMWHRDGHEVKDGAHLLDAGLPQTLDLQKQKHRNIYEVQ